MTAISTSLFLTSQFINTIDKTPARDGVSSTSSDVENNTESAQKASANSSVASASSGAEAAERLQKSRQAHTLFLTQQIAQLSIGSKAEAADDAQLASAQSTSAPGGSGVAQDFLDYMAQTPEQRYFEALLAEKDLTPEEFAALPRKEQLEIQQQIQRELEERVVAEATALPGKAAS